MSLYPNGFDTLNTTRVPGQPGIAEDSNDQASAIIALQHYVGLSGSIDPTTLTGLIAAATGGTSTPVTNAGANSFVALAGPGSLVSFTALNRTAGEVYILFFDSTAVQTNGATPVLPGFQLPRSYNGAAGGSSGGVEIFGTGGLPFDTGIACAFSTDPNTLALLSPTGLSVGVLVRG